MNPTSSSSIELRSATGKDVPGILEIVNFEIAHSTSNYNYDPSTLEEQQEWLKAKQNEKLPVLVAVLEDRVCGFGTYGRFRPKVGYKFSLEHSVYIAKDKQGLGIGSAILTALIETARAEGYHTMIAGIDASNAGSIRFHERFGFTEVARLKEVGYKFDRWLDLVFLQLMLNSG